MQTTLDCIPCFVRQALDAARLISDDREEQGRLMRSVMQELARLDLSATPPQIGRDIHRALRKAAGCDPYVALKEACNRMAERAIPEARSIVESADDPFEMAIRFAMAGNNIDAGVGRALDESHLHEALFAVADTPIDHAQVAALRRALDHAKDILFLGDNCGEIYFDRLLLERMPTERITYVVRGGPIINDATLPDAETAGITELVPVIDNGDDTPGTLLSACSEAFLKRWARADLVVAKGQGNYETLSDCRDQDIFFLLRAKCPVIAAHIGCPQGTFLILRNRRS